MIFLKTYYKHSDCELAKENLRVIYAFIKQALNSVNDIIVESGSLYFSKFQMSEKHASHSISFNTAYRNFEDKLDLARNNMITPNETLSDNSVINAMNELIESTQDFTDSLCIQNEQRERIIKFQNEIREQTNIFLKNENAMFDDSDSHQEQPLNNRNSYSRLFQTTIILNNCLTLKKLVEIWKFILFTEFKIF